MMITIPLNEYEDLIEAKRWLDCLEAAGVDNWAGIDDATKLLEEEDTL